MTPDHPRWAEFCDRLGGPEACNFEEGEQGNITWTCLGGFDKTFSERILRDMGFSDSEVAESLAFFTDHGGHCDCEVLFNVQDRFAAFP